jgi:diadenosine tetraphosphate (Ap4A) HIT family hydrolase
VKVHAASVGLLEDAVDGQRVQVRMNVEAAAEICGQPTEPWSEYVEVQRLAWEAARAMDRVLSPKRVFVAALGSAKPLPISFPHHHVHVIPLYDGGELDRPSEVLTWRNGVTLYTPEETAELGAALRAAWGDAG